MPQSFEQRLTKLDEINQTLAQDQLPLDKALHLYEQGIECIREAQKQLDEAEKTLAKYTTHDQNSSS